MYPGCLRLIIGASYTNESFCGASINVVFDQKEHMRKNDLRIFWSFCSLISDVFDNVSSQPISSFCLVMCRASTLHPPASSLCTTYTMVWSYKCNVCVYCFWDWLWVPGWPDLGGVDLLPTVLDSTFCSTCLDLRLSCYLLRLLLVNCILPWPHWVFVSAGYAVALKWDKIVCVLILRHSFRFCLYQVTEYILATFAW